MASAFEYFLKCEVPGESTDAKHKDWIEVVSFQHKVTQVGSAARGASSLAERCNHSDVMVVAKLDKAFPRLMQFCSEGRHLKSVKLEVCRSAGEKQKSLEYSLSDVILTSVFPYEDDKRSLPFLVVNYGLNYDKIEVTYTELDHQTGKAKGDVKTWWSTKENRGG